MNYIIDDLQMGTVENTNPGSTLQGANISTELSGIDLASTQLDYLKSPPENNINPLKQQMIQFGAITQGTVCKRHNVMYQLELTTNKAVRAAPNEMDIAIADFIHSNGLAFCLSECLKIVKIIDVARRTPIGDKPPDRRTISGRLLAFVHSH